MIYELFISEEAREQLRNLPEDRVEELEDARELEAAMSRNGDKPLIPWEQAKQDLGL